MNNCSQRDAVLKLVNLARAAYGAPKLEALLSGQLHSASFCTIGRSLRRGVEAWLFVAVGSRHLRLWALGKDSAAIAKQIMKAWGMPHQPQPLLQLPEKPGSVTFALPAEICEFVAQFDSGLLPDYQGEVGQIELRQLSELARAMPLSLGQRSSCRTSGIAHRFDPAERQQAWANERTNAR